MMSKAFEKSQFASLGFAVTFWGEFRISVSLRIALKRRIFPNRWMHLSILKTEYSLFSDELESQLRAALRATDGADRDYLIEDIRRIKEYLGDLKYIINWQPAYKLGRAAHRSGQPEESNPFDRWEDFARWRGWRDGWRALDKWKASRATKSVRRK